MALTQQLPDWFVTEFDDEVRHKFQQMTSLLRSRVFFQSVKGDTVQWPILTKSTVTKNKPANQDQNAETGGHSKSTATLDNYTTGRYVAGLDVEKFNGNLMSAYTESQAAACGRELDAIILTAIDTVTTTANSNINEVAGGLTYEKLLTGRKNMTKFGMSPSPDNSTLCVDEEGWEDLATETEFQSTDFVTYRVAETGNVPVVLGYQVVVVVPEVIPNRVVTTAPSFAYAFNRMAAGLAVNKDCSTSIDRVPEKFSDFIGTEFSAVGGTIDPNGLFRYDVGQS